jgi:hypothetical protein
MAKEKSDDWYLKKARDHYEKEGEIEVDLEPPPGLTKNRMVSRGADNGAYVMAWVWVYDNDKVREQWQRK